MTASHGVPEGVILLPLTAFPGILEQAVTLCSVHTGELDQIYSAALHDGHGDKTMPLTSLH